MSAAELLAHLNGQGFTLAPEGDGIRVTPASRLTADLRQANVAHRPALLAVLAEPEGRAPAFVWDQAEAERLLAELRDGLARLERDRHGGRFPSLGGRRGTAAGSRSRRRKARGGGAVQRGRDVQAPGYRPVRVPA